MAQIDIASIQEHVAQLTEGIVSSIPYLLAADVYEFVEKSSVGSPLVPGRLVGGLVLMYMLYVLLTLPVVEPKLRVYIRDCLA
jgi:Na+/H+-dicarboxylate symporter